MTENQRLKTKHSEKSMTYRAVKAEVALEDAKEKGLSKFELAIAIQDPQPARAVSEVRQARVDVTTKMEKRKFLIFGLRPQARYWLTKYINNSRS